MTWVDLAVLGVIAVSAMLAFMRGLVREVLGIGAWVGAGFVAAWGQPLLRPTAVRWFGESPWTSPGSFVAIFVVALIVLMLVAHAIGRMVRGSALGGLDRTLGLVFGIARGAAVVIIAYIVAGMVVPVDQWPPPVREARLLTPAYEGASWAIHQLPADYRPHLAPPPAGRTATAEALLHATPQGSALSHASTGTAARD
jgi:membrane protein required for colicin V production